MLNCFYSEFDTLRLDGPPVAKGDYRSPFQIDRDRILHSAALRRLQGKTQVFYSFLEVDYDFYRTRLTHSLEVAQIGRSICSWLSGHDPLLREADYQPDADLVEAASLAHDLGHPPFGHEGERELHKLMQPYGGFEGNAQTLRMLTRLLFSEHDRGMNPTRALLDAVLKYKVLRQEAPLADHHYLYNDQETVRTFVLDGGRPLDTDGPLNKFRSLECQIMDWSDDTAYSINDLADGIQTGFITVANLEAWAAAQSLSQEETAHVEFLVRAIREKKFEARLSRSIGEHITACSLVLRPHNCLSEKTRRHDFTLVVQEDVRLRAELHKRIAKELVFKTTHLQQLDYKASYVLRRLFEALQNRYIEPSRGERWRLLPMEVEQRIEKAETPADKARLVCDWIANATERGVIRTHRRLFDPDFGLGRDML